MNFFNQMDWVRMMLTVFSALAALMCITIHELCHGLMAYRLGDPTAKLMGRLTLNPIRHIDPMGLLLLVVARVGWAKPVPVNMANFKNPRRDMALTALAGPVSNFILAWIFLLAGRVIYHFVTDGVGGDILFYVLLFFLQAAILSIGLGVFNLFPIPPLDGSKVLFSLLPDRAYHVILRYERYGMILMFGAVFLGILNRPLSFLMMEICRLLCLLSGMPFQVVGALFF